jgi:glycosyltransferase involved in cell wall biosynthesis
VIGIRILQIAPIVDVNRLWTGPHRIVYDISRELSFRGHQVTLCTSDMSSIKTKLNQRETEKEAPFETIRLQSLPKWNKIGMIVTPTMNQFIREKFMKYDVVHTHEYRTYQNLVVHRMANRLEFPYIIQAHGSIPRIGLAFRKLLFDQFFGYNILKNASIAIAVSPSEVNEYCRFGVQRRNIEIVPNALNLSEFKDLPLRGAFREKLSLGPSNQLILYLGRLNRIKGIDVLISAFQLISTKYKKAHLAIAGPGANYRIFLQKLVRTKGLEQKVHFQPPLFGRNKLQAFVDADVFVLPSFYEIFGLVILEAQACMTPVIASRVGGIKNIVKDSSTGFLFEKGNIDELAERIGAILDDQKHALNMTEKARKNLEEYYTIEKTVNRLERIYARL